MKTLVLIAALSLPLSPALAQEAAPAPDTDEGFSLIEEGAKLLFRGFLQEMEPAIGEMGKAVAELEPALQELLAMIDDIQNYSAPEKLPNGDIIIRRKPPEPQVPDANPEIEL